jgi:hypothetical protein
VEKLLGDRLDLSWSLGEGRGWIRTLTKRMATAGTRGAEQVLLKRTGCLVVFYEEVLVFVFAKTTH